MTRSSWKAEPAGPRSIALVGPYGSGKSTLFDALMTAAGVPVKRTDNRNRSMSTELRLGHCTFMEEPWAIIDCPGSIEFSYDTLSALMVCDLAVIVCEPSPERVAGLALIMKTLEDRKIPHLIFINKIDMFAGHVRDFIAALQNYSKCPLVLRQVPIRESDNVTGYVDVVSERAYRYRREQDSELITLPNDMRAREQEARAGLSEILADHDDAIMEKVLEDVAPSSDELFKQLHNDQASGCIVQVLLGAAAQGFGILRLWKALRHDAPNAWETAQRHGIAVSDQPLVQVFKTVHAGQAAYTGKLSLARVWRGALADGATLNGSRMGGVYHVSGGEPVRVPSAQAGELVALGRLEAATGSVLGLHDPSEILDFPPPPTSVFALSIATKDRKDDVKLSTAIHKLVEEDPSLTIAHDQETGETLLRGQGEIHLNVALDKLASNYNLQINVGTPKIAFKETIKREVHQHARLKRQTGGHGQFADVKLELRPRDRGEGFAFTDKIVGGAVPRQYIPAVREASEEAMHKGPFGYPVVDVGVTLVDGTFHTVDSSDMAFRTCTRQGVAEALGKAEPVLLEPIDHVTVSVPNQFTPGVQRLLTGRRGQILGYAEREGWPGWDDVEALVPEAELHDFILQLRSDTMGLGSYRSAFDHLAEARGKIAEKVAAH
jgi:elongation factor G